MADDLLYRYAGPSPLGPSDMELATSGEPIAAERCFHLLAARLAAAHHPAAA